jgi:hypothetical protein
MIVECKYLEQIDDHTVIWRYMDFVSFYAMLTTSTLFFRRLDKHSDQFEGTLSDTTINKVIEYRKAFPDGTSKVAEEWAKHFAAGFQFMKSIVLCNCWTINDEENYALWRIYLNGNKEGIAIKSNGKRLKDSLQRNKYKIDFGKVIYDEKEMKLPAASSGVSWIIPQTV